MSEIALVSSTKKYLEGRIPRSPYLEWNVIQEWKKRWPYTYCFHYCSAPPSIMKPPQKSGGIGAGPGGEKKRGATIEAKPQIKNVMGDVTRFMPTALKVKRVQKDSKGRIIRTTGITTSIIHLTVISPSHWFTDYFLFKKNQILAAGDITPVISCS